LDDLLAQLNEDQKRAATTTEGCIRVIAGAGSGKTRTLTTRYAYLVSELGIAPSRIMSVTFTNKAANEMKSRIRRMLGDVDTGFINTFHGFALRVLKEEIHRLNYPQNFGIMDEEDQKSLLTEIYEELGLKLKDYTFKNILNIIGYHKTSIDYVRQLIEPDEKKVAAYFAGFTQDTKTKVLGKYLQKQRRNFMLDFDDVINFVLYLFETDSAALEKWQEQLQYIQVDEFQDVDGKQASLVYLLSGGYGNLFVVGDPDQTIYSWRGADVNIILDFDKVFPHAQTIFLDTNYRSTPQILNVGNALIRHNEIRLEKILKPVKPGGPRVYFKHARSAAEEASFIAQTIKSLRDAGTKLDDIAILYRAHYLSRSLEETFVKEDIPYVLFNGVEFYNRKEIKDVLCYMRMPFTRDDIAFLRTVNTPRRNIGRKRIAYLLDYAERNNCKLFDALKQSLNSDLFAATKARAYVDLVDRYTAKLHLPLPDYVDGLLRESGYEEKLMQDADQNRIDNVSELKNSIQEYVNTAGEDVSIQDYLGKIALFTNLDREDRPDSVKLMTVHTAKGLEFPYVFVCGLSEGVFPSGRMSGKTEMEEERRLAYVAFTRAGNALFLTDSEGRNYDASFRRPSRFLFNIGCALLELDGMTEEEFNHQARQNKSSREQQAGAPGSISLAEGDRISHPAFGKGTIERITPSGYEIRFDTLKGLREIAKGFGRLVKL